MGDAHLGIEQDTGAAIRYPVAKFDVFDTWSAKSLIEAGSFDKCGAADGPASAPEGEGRTVCRVMHIAMCQIAVLGTKSGIAKRVIVGSDNGGEAGISYEMLMYPFQGVGMDTSIGVEEYEDVPVCKQGGMIAAGGGANIFRHNDDVRAELFRNDRTVVRGTIIDDYEFIGRTATRRDSLQRLVQQFA